ncbi:MAG: RAMP superfamily CRISPR-associated protein [Chloroflexales bacterium]
MSNWDDSRKITTRLVLTGDLVLTTPAHMGNGDRGEAVDLILQRDPLEGCPLLPGTSIAGALRAYLQAHEYGHRELELKEQRNSLAQRLFGGTKRDPHGNQSPLIVDDALANQPVIEIRDGVGIDPKRRVASDKIKYDLELLPVGTIFPLRFELLRSDDDSAAEQALALALQGLERGEIILGARRSRGFGRCQVKNGWRLTRYNVHEPKDLLAWLRADLDPPPEMPLISISELLKTPAAVDKRNAVQLTAVFELASPLLIRAEQPLRAADGALLEGDTQPDVIHLVNAAGQPVLPGTSLAGALRARAGRILRTFHDDVQVTKQLESLFGWTPHGEQGTPCASRLLVEEACITESRTLVQSRVGIDRFTGGALDTALFHEAPCVAGRVQTTITIINPTAYDVGLLLLLLKDLWSGDLPLGGAASIGHGRLRGVEATLIWGKDRQWHFSTDADLRLHVAGDPAELEGFVAAVARKEGTHAA